VVLAADSASTLVGRDEQGRPYVVTVYNNANKIFNLRKGLPIGAVTWGAGSIGNASISTLIKDLRLRFAGLDASRPEWEIDPSSYSVADVATRLRQFVFEELYEPAFKDWEEKPTLGFVIAGYSSGAALPEEYMLQIDQAGCGDPMLLRKEDQSGVNWNGEPEAIYRLLLGYSSFLPSALTSRLKMSDADKNTFASLLAELNAPVVQPAMPIQDAIDVAEFLVDSTIKFSRFTPGAATVGGPIEIAAITKHEGYRWIKRKYYFARELNPEESPS
jgi:hypothetical protein